MTGWFISGSDEDEGSYESDANPAKNEKKCRIVAKKLPKRGKKNLAKSAEKVLKLL